MNLVLFGVGSQFNEEFRSTLAALPMSSRTVRRRIRHGDVDGKFREHMDIRVADSLDEPLLGTGERDTDQVERCVNGSDQDLWDDQKKETMHWSFLFSQLITQWAQWLESILLCSTSLVGKLVTLPLRLQNRGEKAVYISPLQEQRLRALRKRLEVPYDGSQLDHQHALKELWKLAYPGRQIPPLKSELWKDMGWQGTDPSTDFRGGGFISLENLIFFAKKYPDAFRKLLNKEEGNRSEWEYPFAVAGINISFMLSQMLDLQSELPSSKVGIRFVQLLAADEAAFDELYCVAFKLLDAQWLARRASYMEFNEIVKMTRMQLERELLLDDVVTIADLPAYTMLMR
ncbi:ELMO/CED-12 family protein [Wolffia australiana]